MKEQRPFAVFDIDGTLIRWQLYHAIGDALAKTGLIEPDAFAAVKNARLSWKRRDHATSFQEYELEVIKAYDAAITNISVEDFMQAARNVFDEYKDQTYTYTRDLIRKLKAEGYLLFAISASQAEVVEMLAEYYGFDDFGGSRYETKDGKFTGKKYILKSAEKPVHLKELVKKHGAQIKGSVAVGDSDGDILMLETVEIPIAFNPNKLLFQHAKQQGWKIVIERKNMVYELEAKNGNYELRT
jgi:HAD superfamily hydrolase (TIGR01490 family)